MDDYFSQMSRTLEAARGLARTQARGVLLDCAQSANERASEAERRARQAEQQAAAARQQAQQAQQAQRAQREREAQQHEARPHNDLIVLRYHLDCTRAHLEEAQAQIRELQAQLRAVTAAAEAEAQAAKKARRVVNKALAEGDLDALAQASPAVAQALQERQQALDKMRANAVRQHDFTRAYFDVVNGCMWDVHRDVLSELDVDVARYESLRMHQIYQLLHRAHPEYDLSNNLQASVLSSQFRRDWKSFHAGGWTGEGELPPYDTPQYPETLDPLPPRPPREGNAAADAV